MYVHVYTYGCHVRDTWTPDGEIRVENTRAISGSNTRRAGNPPSYHLIEEKEEEEEKPEEEKKKERGRKRAEDTQGD